MSFKFFGVDASGKRTALTHLSGNVRIFPDRMHIGDAILLRNWDTWDGVSGKERYVEIVAEADAEEVKSAPAKLESSAPSPKPIPSSTRK